MVGAVLIVVLILIPAGVIPAWPHSRQWGYLPQWTAGGGPDDSDHAVALGSDLRLPKLVSVTTGFVLDKHH
jgi:hypothetical protein